MTKRQQDVFAELKEACEESAEQAQKAGIESGASRIYGAGNNKKYGSAREARQAKIEAAKAKRAAAGKK